MRVTINFDIEIGQGKDTMKALILAQSQYVSDALIKLAGANNANLADITTEVAESLTSVSTQLKQYVSMLSDLEKVYNQTILPTPVSQPEEQSNEVTEAISNLKEQVENVKEFTKFMEKVGEDVEEG
tara:strand:+ start:24 stop:404 length:381 start_codon:yes stop_codon:yes gene_type:complete